MGMERTDSGIVGGLSPVAYCLDRRGALPGRLPASVTPLSTGLRTSTGVITRAAPYYSQFPYLSNIDETANLDYSNYNGLQVTVTERPTHGLTFLAGYTFAHALDIASSDSATNDATDAPTRISTTETGTTTFAHRFTLSTTYALPGIKFPAQMLEGWSVSAIVQCVFGVTLERQ